MTGKAKPIDADEAKALIHALVDKIWGWEDVSIEYRISISEESLTVKSNRPGQLDLIRRAFIEQQD